MFWSLIKSCTNQISQMDFKVKLFVLVFRQNHWHVSVVLYSLTSHPGIHQRTHPTIPIYQLCHYLFMVRSGVAPLSSQDWYLSNIQVNSHPGTLKWAISPHDDKTRSCSTSHAGLASLLILHVGTVWLWFTKQCTDKHLYPVQDSNPSLLCSCADVNHFCTLHAQYQNTPTLSERNLWLLKVCIIYFVMYWIHQWSVPWRFSDACNTPLGSPYITSLLYIKWNKLLW